MEMEVKPLLILVTVISVAILIGTCLVFTPLSSPIDKSPIITAVWTSTASNSASPLSTVIEGEKIYPTPSPSPIIIATQEQWELLHPLPPELRKLLEHGPREINQIALTFDICQSEGDIAGYDAEIVRILKEKQIPATFFLGGLWMRDHVNETLELANNPLFELGNHSWSHKDFSHISEEMMDEEILQTQKLMWELLGKQPQLFRFPYGTYNDTALNVVGENGLYAIQWDVVSGDPDPNILAEPMIDWVLQQLQPGTIVIMHANGRGWHTAEALPSLIDQLQRDYTFVTISKLLNITK